VYKKVVIHNRGGFCYELNSLFNWLLRDIGFRSRIISARILDEFGNAGPEFDHMVICIETDKKYIADVGYGDLFIKPIEIKQGIQHDGRNRFKIEKINNHDFVLSMASDNTNFVKKYAFTLGERSINEFYPICLEKQTNPDSYFVKNVICTKPTMSGRITLFNNKLSEKHNEERIEKLISDDTELRSQLREKFGIVIR
jgi:N-hydroxyarylamine O-acetyltransferase